MGRTQQLGEVIDALIESPLPVVVISGRPGVGKTALAVKVSHEVKEQFQDGVLYVDFSDHSTLESLFRDLLSSFEIAQEALPASLNLLITTYRSVIGYKNCLLVLDNVENEQDVARFIPPAGASAVLITTRSQSLGSVASKQVYLQPLSDVEAIRLFELLAGIVVDDLSRPSVLEIVRMCENIPLAVRLATSRLTSRRHWRLQELRARLTEEGGKLRVLRSGRVSMTSSILLSYEELSGLAKRALRLLAFLHLPQFTSWTISALLGITMNEAVAVVDELDDANLFEPLGGDRNGIEHFRLHDLVADFGALRAAQDEPADSIDEAATALVKAYSHLLGFGARTLEPDTYRLDSGATDDIEQSGDETDPRLIGDVHQWFIAERPNLLSLTRVADRLELWVDVWNLSYRLIYFLDYFSYWQDWEMVQSFSQKSAEQLSDPMLRAYSISSLGDLYRERGDFAHAADMFEESLQLLGSVEISDEYLRGRVLLGRGQCFRDQGQFGRAIESLNAALDTFEQLEADRYVAICAFGLGGAYRALGEFEAAWRNLDRSQQILGLRGDRRRQALALRSLGATERELDLFEEAQRRYVQCLALFTEIGDKRYRAVTVRSIATLRINQGRLREAEELYREAIPSFQQLGDTRWEALTEVGLGAVLILLGRVDQARDSYLFALSVLERLGDQRWESITHLGLAIAYLEASDEDQARVHADSAQRLFESLGDSRRLRVMQTLQTLVESSTESQASLFSDRTGTLAVALIDAMISD